MYKYIIIVLLLIGGYQYYLLSEEKKKNYLAEIKEYNSIVTADSLRQINDTRYARLVYKYFNLDSVAHKFIKTIRDKHVEINSLTKINAKLIAQISNIPVLPDSGNTGVYSFKYIERNCRLSGKFHLYPKPGYMNIDSLIIPLNFEIAYITQIDNMIEVQVDVDNSWIKVNNIQSYIKVPRYPSINRKPWGFITGATIGNSWGIVNAFRYKTYYMISTLQNKGWSIGAGYEF